MDIDYVADFNLDVLAFDGAKGRFGIKSSSSLQLNYLCYCSKVNTLVEEALMSFREYVFEELHLDASVISCCVGRLNFIRDVRGRYIPTSPNLEAIVTSEDILKNSERLEDNVNVYDGLLDDFDIGEILKYFGYEVNFDGLNEEDKEKLVKNLTGKSISEIEDIYYWADERDLMYKSLSDL